MKHLTLPNWENFLIVLGAVVYLLMFPHGIHGDAEVRHRFLLELLETGKLPAMVYSYVHPLFSAPLLLLGNVYKDGFWWISRFNTFLFLATLAIAGRALRRHHGWSAEGTRLALLLLLAATMFPKHSTDYYAEVFSCCFALFSILAYQRGRSALAVLALCLSVWNVIATVVGAGVLLVFFALRSRRWRYLAALPLLPAGFLFENWLKYGEAYPTAYMAMQNGPFTIVPYAMGPGFSYPLFFGLLNNLFSFGRGLLWFAPGLLLLLHPALRRDSLRRRTVELFILGLAYLAGLLVIYSKFWAWHGGAFWGPRYLLFGSLLAALALAAFRAERAGGLGMRVLWIAAALLSFWVGCQGVMYGTDFLEPCYSRGHELEFACHYVPQFSVLWRYFTVLPELQGRRVGFLIYFLLVAGTVLWHPVKETGAELLAMLRQAVKNYGNFSSWRI